MGDIETDTFERVPAPSVVERVENDARRDKLALTASAMGQAAVWLERNASTLARIGVGDHRRVLLHAVDDEGELRFFVYGDEKQQKQTFAAIPKLFEGEWDRRGSLGDSFIELFAEFEGFVVVFAADKDKINEEAPTGAERR